MSNDKPIKWTPMLFTGEMVRAWLDGRKHQTRRVIKPSQSKPKIAPLHMKPATPDEMAIMEIEESEGQVWIGSHPDYPTGEKWFTCPYGKPGDRLWVRENLIEDARGDWCYEADNHPVQCNRTPADESAMLSWLMHRNRSYCPSIHMPRWASRITLEITSVRNEKVQDITPEDAIAEGINYENCDPDNAHQYWREESVAMYGELWDAINAKRGYPWQANPWVWVIEAKAI